MLDTPKKMFTSALLALLMTPFAVTVLADEPEDDDARVVFKRRICPAIRIGGNQNVRWLGYSNRVFLGVELTDLSPELRGHFGVPGDAGVMISRVVEDSAAEAAGLAVGDIITHVDGEEVGSSGALGRAIRGHEGGESVGIEFHRDGSTHQVTATLAEHERCAFDVGEIMEGIDFEELSTLGLGISEEVLKGLQEAFEGQDWGKHFEDWGEHFEGLGKLNLEGLEGLEERMERVQERLRRLERELEREGRSLEREDRRIERDRSRDRQRGSSEGTELDEDQEDSAEDLETVRL